MENGTVLYGIYKRDMGTSFTGIIVPSIEVGKKILAEMMANNTIKFHSDIIWDKESLLKREFKRIDNYYIFKPVSYINEYFKDFEC